MRITVRKIFEEVMLLILKTDLGAMTQEMQAASRSWKKARKGSPLEPPEGRQPC